MDIDDLSAVTALRDKRLTLVSIKTAMEGTGQVDASGRNLSKYITAARVTAARAAILPLINAEIADVDTALEDLDVQVD